MSTILHTLSTSSPEYTKAVCQIYERFTQKMTTNCSFQEMLEFIYHHFKEILPFNRLGYAEIDHATGIVTSRFCLSDRPVKLDVGFSGKLKGSSLNLILEQRRPRFLNNLLDYLEEHPKSYSTQQIVDEGLRSSFTCPLMTHGIPIGFLFFTSDRINAYSEIHASICQEISGQLALYLALQDEREHTHKILAANLDVVIELIGLSGGQTQDQIARLLQWTHEIVDGLPMVNAQRLEMATRLSQIDCIMKPEQVAKSCSNPNLELLQKIERSTAMKILTKIADFDDILQIIEQQKSVDQSSNQLLIVGSVSGTIELEASILKATIRLDQLMMQSNSASEAIQKLLEHADDYHPQVIQRLVQLQQSKRQQEKKQQEKMQQEKKQTEKKHPNQQTFIARCFSVYELKPMMELAADVFSVQGVLLAKAGQILTPMLINRLRSLHTIIKSSIAVQPPAQSGQNSGLWASICNVDQYA